jgi:hypothetical protein
MLHRTDRQQTSSVEILRLSEYMTRARQTLEAATSAAHSAIKARTRARTIMEMPAKQTPAASSEIVKLIRKLRWVGLEEKAEQLEKELEQQPATDTVLATQCETD